MLISETTKLSWTLAGSCLEPGNPLRLTLNLPKKCMRSNVHVYHLIIKV